MYWIPVCAALVMLAAGCAHVDYVGESHPRTDRVDLFFSEGDIGRPYKVVGQVLATGDQYTSAARVQRRLMQEARERGADGVLILEVARVRGPEHTRHDQTTTKARDEDGTTVQTTETVSDLTAESKRIRALFIKYRE